ncbi:MAG: hypothetical protein QW814_03760 [Methanothrix sp.]
MLFNKYKPNNAVANIPSKLMTSNVSDIANEAKSVTDFSYSDAFMDSKILIIGDTDHRNAKIVGSLANSIEDIAASGVKRFLIEMPKDPKVISAIAELNSNGNVEMLSEVLDRYSRNPLQLLKLIKAAHANGIEVIPIDMPFSLRKDFDDKTIDKERGIYMGNEIAEYSKITEGKIAVFCGLNHLNPDQIPAVLKSKSVDYRSAAIFTENQSTSLFLDTQLIEQGVCQYVEAQNRKNKNTLISLRGSYGIDSILYLKWVPEEHSDSKSNASAKGYLELKLRMHKDVYADFSDSVEPDSKLWKDSNMKKIVSTMGMFGDYLNEFQKFYLSMALDFYLNSTMRNAGGSIVDIKYDGSDQAFKVRTVDTFHYKYSKDADYGASMRYREVTVGMLLSQYGMPKYSFGDESTFRNIISKIKLDPIDKAAAYKMIYMALASQAGMGTIKSDSEGVYLANKYGEKAVSISIEEVKKDERTSKILEAGREILEWSLAVNKALNETIDYKSMGHKARHAMLEESESGEMLNHIYFFMDGISSRVLKAYSKFELLDDSEFSSLANDFINEASVLEESIKHSYALHPNYANNTFNINSLLISDKRYISSSPEQTDVKTLVDSCIKVLEEKKEQIEGELSMNGYESTDAGLLRK